MRRSLLLIACVLVVLAGCSNDPNARRADAIEDNVSTQAKPIKADVNSRADALNNSAARLSNEANRVGGFEGQSITAKAEQQHKESANVRAQGAAKADTVKTQGEAAGKAIRSQ